MPSSQPSILRRSLLATSLALALPAWARAAARPTPRVDGAPGPTLATVYAGQVDPALCLVSEKYDGVRATWDGTTLRHRSGRTVAAPATFLAGLPRESLDGELWLGRGRFDALSATVRRQEPRASEWAQVRYMVFEMPEASGTFTDRLERLAAVIAHLGPGPVVLAPQRRVADRAELMSGLDAVVAAGGEGLVLHVASAPYVGGRNEALLKLKPHLDAEAIVVGYQPGAGKYRGLTGALEVESAEGRRFLVGSGLTDASRRVPPPIGTSITYRYRDRTATGLPRFATYLRRHEAL